jgi:hypothetical protein
MSIFTILFRSSRSHRPRRLPASVRPVLEHLEDRCLPSANFPQPSLGLSPVPTASPGNGAVTAPMVSTRAAPAVMSTTAPLTHDQVHTLMAQTQLQTVIETIDLDVDQLVLANLQQRGVQTPPILRAIASLTSDIVADQAVVQNLQQKFSLLSQLDADQDQVQNLNTRIQFDTAAIPILQRFGARQIAVGLQSTIDNDQAAIQALQPGIDALEQEVSAFIG